MKAHLWIVKKSLSQMKLNKVVTQVYICEVLYSPYCWIFTSLLPDTATRII